VRFLDSTSVQKAYTLFTGPLIYDKPHVPVTPAYVLDLFELLVELTNLRPKLVLGLNILCRNPTDPLHRQWTATKDLELKPYLTMVMYELKLCDHDNSVNQSSCLFMMVKPTLIWFYCLMRL